MRTLTVYSVIALTLVLFFTSYPSQVAEAEETPGVILLSWTGKLFSDNDPQYYGENGIFNYYFNLPGPKNLRVEISGWYNIDNVRITATDMEGRQMVNVVYGNENNGDYYITDADGTLSSWLSPIQHTNSVSLSVEAYPDNSRGIFNTAKVYISIQTD